MAHDGRRGPLSPRPKTPSDEDLDSRVRRGCSLVRGGEPPYETGLHEQGTARTGDSGFDQPWVHGRLMLARLLRDLLGDDLSVAVSTWEGERAGPSDASATVVIRSPKAVARMVQAPGQLGLARAYVAGDIEVEGDIFAVVEAVDALEAFRLSPAQWVQLARIVGPGVLRRLPAPAEEAHLRGRRHSRARDRAAIAYHYDVSNEFFRTILGPSMTYSCALFAEEGVSLEEAQSAKHELICQKLSLRPGDRLLDIGCGWGALVAHAARHHDVQALGVTLSAAQVEWAAKALVDNDLTDRATVRFQDYREVTGGPFDAVSSVGMSEHVGRAQLHTYFEKLFRLVRPGGRLVNHAISDLPRPQAHWPGPLGGGLRHLRPGADRDDFIDRYVFPDGELVEVGAVVSAMQMVGFEVRHVESLREHYGLTLRRWVANLEDNWDAAVAAAGLTRARTWRLYLAASARSFETANIGVHQVLAVKPDGGRSGFSLRPDFA